MNIDELKDAWSKDEPKGMNLPMSTEMLGKTTSAVGKLRKKMKAEFVSLLICYAFIIAMLFKGVRSPLYFDITCILIFSWLVINIFYYFRFYVFYKSMSRYDLSMAKSISKIVYELELNGEIYKTHSFSAIPLSILISIALIASKLKFDHLPLTNGFLSFTAMLVIFLIILISFAITYVFINLHVRLSYGKYIDELKQVMDDLGEDA